MLLTARYVLPVSEPHIVNGGIVVKDDKIVEVGYTSEMILKYPGEEVIDFGLAALMPGFIDVHSHIEYAVMRGLIEDKPFADWKMTINAKSRLLNDEDWNDSAILGGLEAVASGITCIADATATGASLNAAREIGLRAVVYREVKGMAAERMERSLRKAVADITDWRDIVADDDRYTIGISPESTLNCNPKLFSNVAEFAADGTPVTVHLGTSKEEELFVRYGSSPFQSYNPDAGAGYGVDMPPWTPKGVSPVHYLVNWGILDAPNVLAIHCCNVSDRDIDKLAQRDVAVAYCPVSNAKLSMGSAPVHKFLRAGMRVGLGTDSPAASDSLDPIDCMRVGLLLQRAISGRRDFINTESMVRMATLGAAEALKLDDRIGSLEAGKQADIIAVDLSNSHHTPTHDPTSAIVYTANQDNVIMTMVDGKILLDEGLHCSGVDPVRARARAREIRPKLRD